MSSHRKHPPFTAAEIAKMRELIKGGTKEAQKIAAALGRAYTGKIWYVMRQHCGDLLPPVRTYSDRSTTGFKRTHQQQLMAHGLAQGGRGETLKAEPWKPGDPKPEWLRRAG